jgi:hypothetical protein
MTSNQEQELLLIGDKVKMLHIDQVGEVVDFYWNKDGEVIVEIAFEDGFTFAAREMVERVEIPWNKLN